jgi:hypothetical protein
VCWHTQQPTKPVTLQIKSGCLACLYICGAAYALPCFAWNISINIIFLVDSIVANGYVGIITSNEQRIKPMKIIAVIEIGPKYISGYSV